MPPAQARGGCRADIRMVDRAASVRKAQPCRSGEGAGCATLIPVDLRVFKAVDPTAVRDSDLRQWRSTFPDATPIAELARRHPGTCVGVVHAIRLVPRRSLEVTIEDGSGRLVAVWPGRTRLPGLELGAALRLTGTMSEDEEGVRRMLNPAWTPVSEPYG
jgi:hypothetical protein